MWGNTPNVAQSAASRPGEMPRLEDPLADIPSGMGLIEYITGDHE